MFVAEIEEVLECKRASSLPTVHLSESCPQLGERFEWPPCVSPGCLHSRHVIEWLGLQMLVHDRSELVQRLGARPQAELTALAERRKEKFASGPTPCAEAGASRARGAVPPPASAEWGEPRDRGPRIAMTASGGPWGRPTGP